MIRFNKDLGGGYNTLSSLMELKGYSNLRQFEMDYQIEANCSENNPNLFFNAKPYQSKSRPGLFVGKGDK